MDRNVTMSSCVCVRRVALRKESVDRNADIVDMAAQYGASLSARRAWIEIAFAGLGISLSVSRSPQGERG